MTHPSPPISDRSEVSSLMSDIGDGFPADAIHNVPDANSMKVPGSVICLVTELVLGGVLPWLGDGSPDGGDRFAGSRAMFDRVSGQIAALVPDGGWQGSAAQAYSTRNLAQSQHAKMMRDLDYQIGQLVSNQAEAVERVRSVVITEMVAIGCTFAFCIYCEATMGPAGKILSRRTATVICAFALAVVVGFLIDLAIRTSRNASKARAMTQKLTEMLTRLPALSRPMSGSPDMAFLPSYSPSEYHALPPTIAGLLDVNAPLPQTTDVSLVFADLPGAPEFGVPNLPAPGFPDFGAPHMPIPHLTGMPTLPDVSPDGLPMVPTNNDLVALPGFADAFATVPSRGLAKLPAMAQATAPPSQLTGLSGAASGLGQLANTAGQQAQMIYSLAQQGAQQHATRTGHATQDDDTVGAAADTTTAGRVPVDTATGSSQARQAL